MNILIAGDLVPTKSNYNLFNKGTLIDIIGEKLFSIWTSSEFKIFNLEVPLSDITTPINKCGPNLLAPKSTINGIKSLNPSLITLANNHILDHGKEGLKSTQEILNNFNIPFVGIGDNLNEASKPYIIEKNGHKIGIYACTEHEFSIATENCSGANPFDPLESLDHIQNLKNQCDYVIILYHGGKEHYRYPSPYLQKICRKMIDKGADLVICQHSHCIGCEEIYNSSTIIYGQGNFIFDYSKSDYWKTSFIIKVEIGEEYKISYIPIIKENNVIRIAEDILSKKIINEFRIRSEEILKEGFIEDKYSELADNNLDNYLRNIGGISKWTSRIDRYIFNGYMLKKKYNRKKVSMLQNIIECESHRELFLKGLKK